MTAHVDCCVHQDWATQDAIVSYLPAAWKEYVGAPGSMPWGLGGKDVGLEPPYRDPDTEVLTYAQTVERLDRADAGILMPRAGMLFAADNNVELGRELCAATNRWTVEHWLDPVGSPFLGGLVVPNQVPGDAVAEIRRHSDDERFGVVVMGGNGLGKPFGHHAYHPIYEAAADAGLPVAIHSLGDVMIDTLSHSTAGGLPSFHGEYRALAAQSLMTHVTSLIGQGVFERFPHLRVLLVGGGIAWIPSLLWRLEVNVGPFGRDAPWLRRAPAEYFLDHVRVATYRLERPPSPERLHQLARTVAGLGDVLCFGSGLPVPDADDVEAARALIPPEWTESVLSDNARALFGARLHRRANASNEGAKT